MINDNIKDNIKDTIKDKNKDNYMDTFKAELSKPNETKPSSMRTSRATVIKIYQSFYFSSV